MTFLDYINLGFLWGTRYFPERRRWSNITADVSDTRVFYGYEELGTTDQKVIGGLVKLHDLSRKFQNTPRNPNILYLISSALPINSVFMARLAKKAGVKLVLNQNGVAYPGWYGKGWERCNYSMRKLHELADFIIYQSEFCKMSADRFIGKPGCPWKILYNPVDTLVFTPEERKYPDKTLRLLLAGSHGSFYRPKMAIKVLSLVSEVTSDVELKIAGGFHWTRDHAEAEKQVFEYAESLRIAEKVKYIGQYTQNQAVELFQKADVLLHTKFNDPCPRLVVEAMACGLPIVYSATGGVPELVGQYAGFGVKGPLDWDCDHPPAPEKLATGVLEIIKNLNMFRNAARQQAVENFDVLPWLDEHEKIFSEILA